ncbi:DUF302 domain-containing protein [Sulfurihydrogenibium azorense]|uniref:DUF302 domain-containing protein n=1 Tax=Sulfurihydrogenibium azorense TaxID=309806 RepID=UPI002408FFCD|nr:DUF302 domain-containing protein [Sulfurihydrogenibium azorense]MDM7273620.1 DUF302 domain-containing protein [Sulfurihydrogenibium azorense]
MRKFLTILSLTLLLSIYSVLAAEVQFEKGYYYVVIKNGNFDKVNEVLKSEIENHKWGVIHTMNVDKTVKSNTPHKTYLLCRADYLTEGLKFNKDIISVLIPCRISIYQDKNSIKILVEDVEASSSNFGVEDKRFKAFLRQVTEEMKSILQKTADHFEKRQNNPSM